MSGQRNLFKDLPEGWTPRASRSTVARRIAMKRFPDLDGKEINGWKVEKRRSGNYHGKIWFARHRCGFARWFGANTLTREKSKLPFCRKCLQRPDLRKKPYEALYNLLRLKATKDKIAFALSFEEFLIFTAIPFCEYCFEPVYWAPYNLARYGGKYNLDRKDNDRAVGYRMGNLMVCCKTCNWARACRYSSQRWFEKCVPERRERLRTFLWNPDSDPAFRKFLRGWMQKIHTEMPDLLPEHIPNDLLMQAAS